MYYSITKRIMKTALGFLILVCAFAFAFFIIHFGNETESFDSVGKSFLKTLVMVLGEFEFDDLWNNSESSTSGDGERWSRLFTMFLLVGLIILGSMIMVNLIVAIIISDIEWLNKISREQALINKVRQLARVVSVPVGRRSDGRLAMTLVDCYFDHLFPTILHHNLFSAGQIKKLII